MVILGWLVIALGGTLFVTSLRRTLRANPQTVVPYNRDAEVVPRHTVLMRSVGAALFVAAAVLLGSVTGYWVVLIPAILALGAVAAVAHHNRRVQRGVVRR